MLTILLHSSKTTLKPGALSSPPSQLPALHEQTRSLARYLQSLDGPLLRKSMHLSLTKSQEVYELIQSYDAYNPTLPALDLFLGDIYSGLQAQSFTAEDRDYANQHLFILSGLYGVLRGLDQIQPYRLEMGCKLPGNAHDPAQPNITNLYEFWGDNIAQQLPNNQPVINLSAVEYTKAIFPHFNRIDGLKDVPIISPKFLTVSPKTGDPTFVTVHAKIARGAYARWLIQHRIEDLSLLSSFNSLGYTYSDLLSATMQPVFIAQTFEGLGLSVRLSNKPEH